MLENEEEEDERVVLRRQVDNIGGVILCLRWVVTVFIIVILLYGRLLSPTTVVMLFLMVVLVIGVVGAYAAYRQMGSDTLPMYHTTHATQLNRPLLYHALRLALMQRDFNAEDYESLLQLDRGSGATPAASDTEVHRLPTFTLSESNMELLGRECPICLEKYLVNDTLKTLPCLHQFHENCINRWLQIQARCPVCKSTIH